MEIRRIPIADIEPAAYNPRADLQPGDPDYERLAESLAEFGNVELLVWNERTGRLVGGHQRLKILVANGETEVDVSVVDLPEEREKALNLALNKITGSWDDDKLAELLQELANGPEGLRLTGFDDQELMELIARLHEEQPADETFDPDQAMADPDAAGIETRVQLGEVWQLGRHRLLCGDSTSAENWALLMGEDLAHAIITDPPYGVSYVGGRAAQEERIGAARRGVAAPSDAYWDDMTPDAYRQMLHDSLAAAHRHSDAKAPLYLWFASAHLRDVLGCLAECGWQERNLIVWVKNNGAGALFAQYKHYYEPCIYGHKAGEAPRWHGPSNERTVWEHDKPARNDLHPTMKPAALIARSIANATEPGHLVVDMFLGSGTAIIAAEQLGRRAYGMDLDPCYCDVIVHRWQTLTGKQATLEGDGRSFAELATARGVEVKADE